PHALAVVGERGAVQVGQRLLAAGVVDEQPRPTLPVPAIRRLQRDLHALLDEWPIDGAIEIEATPDRARGGEQLVGREWELHRGRRPPITRPSRRRSAERVSPGERRGPLARRARRGCRTRTRAMRRTRARTSGTSG